MYRETIPRMRACAILPVVMVVLVLLTAGCVPPQATLPDSGAAVTVHRVAVLPFQQAMPADAATRKTKGPILLAEIRTDRPDNSPEKITERLFLEFLKAERRIQIVYPDRAGAAFQSAASGSFKASADEVFRKVGRDLEADGIVVGYVYRWRERKGLPYSVEKPASVAFDIHLYRADDGALLWRGLFDQTQESLMENMLRISFFFKERGRWLTAEELAAAGMEETCKTFPAAP